MAKKVLVTGGAGFIGGHLVETLVGKGYQVRVIDNLASGNRDWVHKSAEFIEEDIADVVACRRATKGMDGIFHLAAMPRVGPSPDIAEICTKSNIVGTMNILLAARDNDVLKLIYSGSSTFYGNRPVPHREEETLPELLNFYGLTKQTGEEYCRLFNRLFGVSSIVLRYFNVYGPRQPQTGAYALVLGIFLRAWMKNEPLILHGGGAQRRDFVHVRDVVRANIMAFESDRKVGTYNVASGENISVKELADLISPHQIVGPERPGDAKETLADISRIRQDLGWQPEVRFADGLAELKMRMKENLEQVA